MQLVKSILIAVILVPVAYSDSLAIPPWSNSAKRGVGLSLAPSIQSANLLKLAALDVPWFYSWAAIPHSGFEAIPDGTDFVPMAWGRHAPANYQSTWAASAESSLYDTLLGFNEPDLASQSNISVQEALALWPTLQATGLRLGSPAGANFNNGWMSQFLGGIAADPSLHVDFIAVHRYGDANAQAFLDHIDHIHNTYNLPIWITEFAVRDATANVPAENVFTDQQVYNFMSDVLPELESRDYVERYAWFHGGRSNPFVTSSALFEDNGELTKLGRLYTGEEEVIPVGGLLANSNFEESPLVAPTYSSPGANDWVTINDADRSACYAHTGRQSLRLAPGLPSGQMRPGIARQAFQVGEDVEVNDSFFWEPGFSIRQTIL